jgi:hypothetical protein
MIAMARGWSIPAPTARGMRARIAARVVIMIARMR